VTVISREKNVFIRFELKDFQDFFREIFAMRQEKHESDHLNATQKVEKHE
jgi:hypothetical protein